MVFEFASTAPFNVFCSVLHIATAVFILMEDSQKNFVNSDVDVDLVRLAWSKNGVILVNAGSISVFLLLGIFSMFTGITHAFYAYRQIKYSNEKLSPGIWFRYIEYSISAPIMIIVIALLFGIREIYFLVCIALLCSATMPFGYIQDNVNRDIKEWIVTPGHIALYPLFGVFVVITTFITTAVREGSQDGTISDFIRWDLNVPVKHLSLQVVNNTVDGWVNTLEPSSSVNTVIIMGIIGILFVCFRLHNFVENNNSFWRLEYTLNATLFAVLKALLCGITEAYVVTLIAGLMLTSAVYVHVNKKFKEGGKNWVLSPHLWGWVPYLFQWGNMLVYFFVVTRDDDNKPPDFVYAIVFGEMLLFSSFAFVQIWYVLIPSYNQKTGGYIRLYQNSSIIKSMDGAYNILSLVAKLFLVYVTFGGIVGQNSG